MSHHHQSDPAWNAQFRRNWNGSPVAIKFFAELSENELDRIAAAHGEKVLAQLPASLIADLQGEEKRDLARAFGRPWLRRLRERQRLNRG